MQVVEIEINGSKLDMYDNEKIVQSFTIINLSDITQRFGEYSNVFKIPKTNNNIQIIEYSNVIASTTNLPYNKTECIIYVNGFVFKKGFVQIIEIGEDISIRFFTGNIPFYDKLKNNSLNNLSLVNQDHTWDLATAIASRTNTSGYIYPIIDYNGLLTTGDIVDVRKILPGYFDSTLMEACCTENGYSFVNNLDANTLQEFNTGIIPFSKPNPAFDANIVAANTVSGSLGIIDAYLNWGETWVSGQVHTLQIPIAPLRIDIGGYGASPFVDPSNLYDDSVFQGIFNCQQTGTYRINHSSITYSFSHIQLWDSIPAHGTVMQFAFKLYKNGIYQSTIHYNQIATSTINGPTTPYVLSGTITGTTDIHLNAGDYIQLKSDIYFYISTAAFSGVINSLFQWDVAPQLYGDISLSLLPNVTFGETISAKAILPDIKQSDYFRDTCLRYCIIPDVDEDNKIVTLRQFTDITNNIANAIDWSNKIDETNNPSLTFNIGDYAQKNNIKHKEDTSVTNIPFGSDFVLSVNNHNLDPEKDYYTSPFAPSEMVTRLGGSSIVYINLYDSVTDTFSLSVQPRRCYIDYVARTIEYTDGTTTISISDSIPLTWFIDSSKSYNMGFGNNQMNRYSSVIIGILKSIKVLKIDIRLNLIDILGLNYFYPIYIEKYNSYFIISSINQFDYTNNDSTEVELIKLN